MFASSTNWIFEYLETNWARTVDLRVCALHTRDIAEETMKW